MKQKNKGLEAPEYIKLSILLPHAIFFNNMEINHLQVSTMSGSFGILPQRLDCVAALTSGLITCTDRTEAEHFIAIDQGILTKAGNSVTISVRNAIAGDNIGELHKAINEQFRNLDEEEKQVRQVMAQLETGFIKNFEQLTKK